MMGGSDKIMVKGIELNNAGQYWHAVEILQLVFAEPENQPAKDLLSDAYKQLCYRQETRDCAMHIWRVLSTCARVSRKAHHQTPAVPT